MEKSTVQEMLKDIIGAQLISINHDGFTVKTANDKEIIFYFDSCMGNCCGYNELEATLYFDQEDMDNAPVITNIICDKKDDADGDRMIITFFGINKTLAQFDSFSYSGSGWCYGATVTLTCYSTNKKATVTQW